MMGRYKRAICLILAFWMLTGYVEPLYPLLPVSSAYALEDEQEEVSPSDDSEDTLEDQTTDTASEDTLEDQTTGATSEDTLEDQTPIVESDDTESDASDLPEETPLPAEPEAEPVSEAGVEPDEDAAVVVPVPEETVTETTMLSDELVSSSAKEEALGAGNKTVRLIGDVQFLDLLFEDLLRPSTFNQKLAVVPIYKPELFTYAQ